MRALDAGSATGEIARKYQLSPKLLERWRGEWRARGEHAFPGSGRRGADLPALDDSNLSFAKNTSMHNSLAFRENNRIACWPLFRFFGLFDTGERARNRNLIQNSSRDNVRLVCWVATPDDSGCTHPDQRQLDFRTDDN